LRSRRRDKVSHSASIGGRGTTRPQAEREGFRTAHESSVIDHVPASVGRPPCAASPTWQACGGNDLSISGRENGTHSSAGNGEIACAHDRRSRNFSFACTHRDHRHRVRGEVGIDIREWAEGSRCGCRARFRRALPADREEGLAEIRPVGAHQATAELLRLPTSRMARPTSGISSALIL